MRKRKLGRSISVKLYDYQITGKCFAAVRKSFQEVVQVLQNEKKK